MTLGTSRDLARTLDEDAAGQDNVENQDEQV